jgi:hypothetical protein
MDPIKKYKSQIKRLDKGKQIGPINVDKLLNARSERNAQTRQYKADHNKNMMGKALKSIMSKGKKK